MVSFLNKYYNTTETTTEFTKKNKYYYNINYLKEYNYNVYLKNWKITKEANYYYCIGYLENDNLWRTKKIKDITINFDHLYITTIDEYIYRLYFDEMNDKNVSKIFL